MTAPTKASPAPDGLELYRLRDDFSRVYNPANDVEQMFVAQIAMSWQRLIRAQAAEQRYFATTDILEAITRKPREYQAITRYVSDCERAWRQAVNHLDRIQHQRRKTVLSAPNARRTHQPATPVEGNVLSAPADNRETPTAVTRAG